LWLLLHFTYTTRSFEASGSSSDCALVVSELKRYLPDYTKGTQNNFDETKTNLSQAIQGAKKLEAYHETSGTNNPSTKVFILVERLEGLKQSHIE
jgi:hypothetical protein